MSEPTSNTVHLVDASPYIFRAFHTLPETLTDPQGRPVNAVYGFASFLLKLIDDEDVTHLGVTFDDSLTTSFRNEIYAAYKADRPEPPAALVAQLDDCRATADALGAATYIAEDYEADDLIGTLCRQLTDDGHAVVIVTSDKDLAQLVSEQVTLLDFARDERYGPDEVRERYGVPPEQIPELLALAGDSTDNIPGVRGVGPRTAAALLEHFDDVAAVYDNLERVSELPIRGAASVQRKLEAGREQARVSRQLTDVAPDAPVAADLDALRYDGADRSRVEALFERLDFGRIRERIPRWQEDGRSEPRP